MLRKLYYTSEITTASLLGTFIMLCFFIYEGLALQGLEIGSLIVQGFLISILHFAFFFIAFFLLINLFDDFLKSKYNLVVVIIIILVSANSLLLFSLYVDTSSTILTIIIANLRIYVATNIAIVFFSMKKGRVGKV